MEETDALDNTMAEITQSEQVEAYIKALSWLDTPDDVQTLVAGNIRAFAGWYRKENPPTTAEVTQLRAVRDAAERERNDLALRYHELRKGLNEILTITAEQLLEMGVAKFGDGSDPDMGDVLLSIKDCAESALEKGK